MVGHGRIEMPPPSRAGGVPRAPAALVALLTLATAACGDVPERDGSDAPALTPLAGIDPDGGAGREPFGRIADLELGLDGSVYVLDALARTVRVFDADGAGVRTVGRPGQGPCELERPDRLLVGPDGDLWVLDLGNGRVTRYAPEGELVATYRPAQATAFVPLALGFGAPGTLRWVGVTSPDPVRPAAAWLETTLEDGLIRPTASAELPFVQWPELHEHRGPGTVVVLPVPFSGEPRFAFGPSGALWYAFTAEPRLRRWTPAGGLGAPLELDLRARPVTPAVRDAALGEPAYDELRDIGDAAVAALADRIPGTRPYLDGFFVDDEGRAWVIRPAEDAPTGGGSILDVYGPDGEHLGSARADLAADPAPRLRNGLLVGVVRDELGVETVARYRVEW